MPLLFIFRVVLNVQEAMGNVFVHGLLLYMAEGGYLTYPCLPLFYLKIKLQSEAVR